MDLPNWVIGACLVGLKGPVSAAGQGFQRKSTLENNALPPKLRKNRFQRSKWVLGLVLFLLAQPLSAIGLIFAPLSLCAPISSSSIILSSIFSAKYCLGERYSRLDTLAVSMCLCGVLGIVVFGPRVTNIKGELNDALRVLDFWNHENLNILIPIMLSIIVFSASVVRFIGGCSAAIAYPILTSVVSCLSESFAKTFFMFFGVPTLIFQRPYEFMASGGIFICLAMSSVIVVSMGSERFDQRFFLPSYVAMGTMWAQIYGLITMGELRNLPEDVRNAFFFFSGLCIASVLMGSISQVRNLVVETETASDASTAASDYCSPTSDPCSPASIKKAMTDTEIANIGEEDSLMTPGN